MHSKTRKIKHKHTRHCRKYGGKSGKKWTTAIAAAQKTLAKTGSYNAAKLTFKRKGLSNARKLFGSVGSLRM